jgi:sugar O-acyltransferase (sialic acid O-acetyltransferase NeuD family)
MKTLYLCGAGNPEGVRLALAVNRANRRWERIVLLDDDAAKHGRSILEVEIIGPFQMLESADANSDELANLVTRTTTRRQAAFEKLRVFGVPFATLIHPSVDTTGVTLGANVTAYENAILSALSTVDEGSAIFPAANVGHGSHLGRGCILAPGAVVNARAQVGEGVYVGTNASILPDLKIGAWASIGSCSAVIEDVPAGALVMGVPAQVLGKPNAVGVQALACLTPAGDTLKRELQRDVSERERSALGRLKAAQSEFIAAHAR